MAVSDPVADMLTKIRNASRAGFEKVDITDRANIERIFKQYDIDTVIHFAAESHVDRSIENPGIFLETNIMGTAVLMDACRKYGIKRYHQVSTDEVYGTLGETGYFMETTPLDPHSPYSSSKASADLFVKAFGDTYKFPINITRCSNNYGPFQFPEKLIPLIMNNTLKHKDLPVYGDGMQIRDWLYVEDHCKAIDMVIRDGKLGEVYNVGGHNEKPNIFIVKSIIEYIKENVDDTVGEHMIKHVTDRKGHDRRYGIDPQKIKDALGWYPETCFEVGIKKTMKWYLDNEEWVQNVVSGDYQNYYDKMYSGKKEL